MTRLTRILQAIDQGLQHTTEPDYHPTITEQRCWRCDTNQTTNQLGLCRDCNDWLHDNQTHPTPPNATLHPPATPPEHLPGWGAPP